MENMFDILKYASEYQIDTIFVIKIIRVLCHKARLLPPVLK